MTGVSGLLQAQVQAFVSRCQYGEETTFPVSLSALVVSANISCARVFCRHTQQESTCNLYQNGMRNAAKREAGPCAEGGCRIALLLAGVEDGWTPDKPVRTTRKFVVGVGSGRSGRSGWHTPRRYTAATLD